MLAMNARNGQCNQGRLRKRKLASWNAFIHFCCNTLTQLNSWNFVNKRKETKIYGSCYFSFTAGKKLIELIRKFPICPNPAMRGSEAKEKGGIQQTFSDTKNAENLRELATQICKIETRHSNPFPNQGKPWYLSLSLLKPIINIAKT